MNSLTPGKLYILRETDVFYIRVPMTPEEELAEKDFIEETRRYDEASGTVDKLSERKWNTKDVYWPHGTVLMFLDFQGVGNLKFDGDGTFVAIRHISFLGPDGQTYYLSVSSLAWPPSYFSKEEALEWILEQGQFKEVCQCN